jgi:hypothetical protein
MTDKYHVGGVYTETIDRVSNSGNGIISAKNGFLNLGKMQKSRAGNKVRFRYLGDGNAKILEFISGDDNPIKRDGVGNKNDLLNGFQ